MPWRLIIFIVIFAVFLIFITFNLENKCDISFGFGSIKEVPVFVTVFTSFIIGLLCALPLVMHIKKKHKGEPFFKNKQKDDTLISSNYSDSRTNDKISKDAASARERFFSKRNKDTNE